MEIIRHERDRIIREPWCVWFWGLPGGWCLWMRTFGWPVQRKDCRQEQNCQRQGPGHNARRDAE